MARELLVVASNVVAVVQVAKVEVGVQVVAEGKEMAEKPNLGRTGHLLANNNPSNRVKVGDSNGSPSKVRGGGNKGRPRKARGGDNTNQIREHHSNQPANNSNNKLLRNNRHLCNLRLLLSSSMNQQAQ